MLVVAVAFNALFSWRYYPASLSKKAPLAEQEDIYAPIRHEDFVYALSEIDSIVDISEEKLLKIYTLATRHNHSSQKK